MRRTVNFGRAFTFPFQDSDWFITILIGGLLSLIPIAGQWIVYGYAIEVARNAYNGDDDHMPEWNDIWGYLVRGLLLQIGFFIWILPLIAVFAVGFVIAAVVLDTSDVAGGILIFSNLVALAVALLIWTAAILPIVGGRFAIRRRFGVMFEFADIFSEIRRAGVSLVLFFVVALVAQFIGGLGLIVFFIGVIFTSFYSNIVTGHAAGQLYRTAVGPEVTMGEVADVQNSEADTFYG